jgi:hypothetical protein
MSNLAIIVDIDGTLADCSHRLHFLQKKPQDWQAFNKEIMKDPVNMWCEYLLDCVAHFETQILLVTGRTEELRSETRKWLDINTVVYNKLFMRKKGDRREDYLVKEEIYKNHIDQIYNVMFVLEDRKQVVDMWRRLGLTCLQCAPGEF